MKKNKWHFIKKSECGSSLMETLLSIAVVVAVMPFAYYRITDTNREIIDMALAKQIIEYQMPLMNFVRLNNSGWSNEEMLKLGQEDIKNIADQMDKKHSNKAIPMVGFIDKYKIKDHTIVDVYLAFDLPGFDGVRTAKLAKAIGSDAGIVDAQGIAFGSFGSWAVASEDFHPGNLVFRASVDLNEVGFEKYLHKVTGNDLNSMKRDLYMSGHDIFNIGSTFAKSAEISNLYAGLVEAKDLTSSEIYFQEGANIDADSTEIGLLNVSGDVIGFKQISAAALSGGGKWSSQGAVTSNTTTISDSVNVGNNLYVKPSSLTTISGFSAVTAHSMYAPLVSTEILNFEPGMGLTLSSDLLLSDTDAPVTLGKWVFPSAVVAPSFNDLELLKISTYNVSDAVSFTASDFEKLMGSGWKDIQPKAAQ